MFYTVHFYFTIIFILQIFSSVFQPTYAGEDGAIIPAKPQQLNTKNDKVNEPMKNKKKKINLDGMKTNFQPHVIHNVHEKTAVKWPMGIVPYYIDTEIYDNITIQRISKTMDTIESGSCVIFKELERKPQDNTDSWLHITNPKLERECVHETRPSENNGIMVVLAIECLHPLDILHTMLHGIGFKDEIANPYRDHFVRILWENIQPKYRPLFRIQHNAFDNEVVDYDPLSVMHFHSRAFSANGGTTIESVIPGLSIGPVDDSLSLLDTMKLKLVFAKECNKRKIGGLLDSCKSALLTNDKEDNKNQSPQDSENDPENKKDESPVNSQIDNSSGDVKDLKPGDVEDNPIEKISGENDGPGDTEELQAGDVEGNPVEAQQESAVNYGSDDAVVIEAEVDEDNAQK